MKKNILMLAFIISFSCSSNDEMKVIETVKYGGDSILKFENIISTCEVIPIRLNEQVFLNEDIELSHFNNTFYLVDYNVNNRIIVLNNEGEFQNFIGTKGKGNGEYLNLRDYHISNDTISIFSDLAKEEYRYLKSGKFIGKNKMNNSFMQILPLSSDRSLYYIGYDAIDDKNRVLEFYKGQNRNKFLKHSANILSFAEYIPVLISHKDGVIVRETISNVLYIIDKNNKISILCDFDFGDYNIPKDYYMKSDPMAAAMELMSKKYASLGRLLVNDNFMIQQVNFNSTNGQENSYGIKDQKDNKWYWINYGNNDLSAFVKGPKLIDNHNNIYFIINKENLDKLNLQKNLSQDSATTDLFIVKCKLNL